MDSDTKPGHLIPVRTGGGFDGSVCCDVAETLTVGASQTWGRPGSEPAALAIQAGAFRENPSSGPQALGVQADLAYTLEARTEVQAVAFSCKDYGADAGDVTPTLRSMNHDKSPANAGGQVAVAFDLRGREGGAQFEGPHETANMRSASGGSSRSYLQQHLHVRRLTPRECERLQGFPDDYTLILRKNGAPAADGPRYKALGNSMAVNVMRWIGERIDAVHAIPITEDQREAAE